MTDETKGFGIIPDPMQVNTESGQLTSQAQRAHEEEIAKQRESEWTLLDEGLTQNTLYDVAQSVAIDLGTSAEDGFDAKQVPELYEGIPAEFHKKLADTDSTNEAWATRGAIMNYLEAQDKLASSGITGAAASVAAGLIDVDSLLIPVSGGTYFGTKVARGLTKAGMKSGRISGSIVGMAAGAEAGAAISVAGATLGTTSDAGDIPASILMGMGFGSTIGALAGKHTLDPYVEINQARKAHDDYLDARSTNFAPMTIGKMSAGAAQAVPPAPIGMQGINKDIFDRAAADINARNAGDVLRGKDNSETTNIDSAVGRFAEKTQNWVDKSPLKSLYTSVADMGTIGNKLSYDLLYHPGGTLDGAAHPAAAYDSMYTQELSVPVQKYHEYAMKFLNRKTDTIKDKATNFFVKQPDLNTFGRAVRIELENRWHGNTDPNVHPAVKEYADIVDDMNARAVSIQKGKAGETPVFGSDELEVRPGYYSRRWDGEAIKKFERDNGVGPQAIEDALVSGYKAVMREVLDEDTIRKIVKSIITRAKALDEGIDTNLVGLLRTNGKEFLRDTLKNNNITDEEIDKIMGALVGDAAERGKPGFLKGRIELDMTTPIPGTNKMLLDLLEPDMYKTLHQYTRRVAGTSAMARKGYQVSDIPDIKAAIKEEMAAKGMNVKDPRIDDILDTAFSYFGAGAVGGGVDPMLMSAMRLTRQSLLGQLGLTQLTELGNVIATSGMEAVMHVMPKELRSVFDGKPTPLVKELHDAFVFLDKDHVLHDDQLALDIVGQGSIVQSQFVDGAHKMLAFGDKLMGYTSLFYKAMTFSQRLAIASVNHKLYKVLKKGGMDAGTERRLLDLGFDDGMAATLQKYINKGIIKLDADGNVRMGFNDGPGGGPAWSQADLQEYKIAMHRFVARAVQKNLPGENPYWVTKPLGQVLTQLRVFPMLAFQKQFLRNMRHADAAAVGSVLYNLAVAGMIYSISETVKGRGGDLSTEKIAKGAINYSPTTGWMPMVTDPLAEIMGLEDFKMNKYGPPGRATDGIIPTPPVIPTLNRLAHLPGAVLGSLDGVDRNEASALSATPIVGSMYGWSALFNYMKSN